MTTATVEIYTANYCPYCMRAKNLLKNKGIAYQEIDITDNPSLRKELEEKTGHMTVPMIFIKGKFIGGFDNLNELNETGKLDSLLK